MVRPPHLTLAFQDLKWTYKETGTDFSRAHRERTRENAFKLKEGRFRKGKRKKFLMMRAMRYWYRLPREVETFHPWEYSGCMGL